MIKEGVPLPNKIQRGFHASENTTMPLKILKKAVPTLFVAIVVTLVNSAFYNEPIRFRPSAVAYPHSLFTPYPSGPRPDQIVLSPAPDLTSGVDVNWRTDPGNGRGVVQYREADAPVDGPLLETPAEMTVVEAPELARDHLTHGFAATLAHLRPGTAYRYRVGDPDTGNWSAFHTFKTVAQDGEAFSFIHFGDLQSRPGEFGDLVQMVDRRHPEAAFYMTSGDMVENGRLRYLWDAFLASDHEGRLAAKPLAPAPGNHEYYWPSQAAHLNFYAAAFNVPRNGPPNLPQGRSYSFTCRNAFFIVLDSSRDLEDQAGWLEKELQKADAAGYDFKIAVFHHPPYNTKPGRSNPEILKNWGPLLERHGVDLVLNGHDHSYLRTKPLKDGRSVASVEGGTIYVTAVSCDKFYDIQRIPEAEVQLADQPTYQLVRIGRNWRGRPFLQYTAYGLHDQAVKDEFRLEK